MDNATDTHLVFHTTLIGNHDVITTISSSSSSSFSPSPSPSSPPLISDQILFIIKAVNVTVLTQAFCLLGSVTNVINIVVFTRIGFTDTINVSLLALAVSDFGSCFVMIFRNIALTPWFQQLDNLPFEPGEVYFLTSLWPHIALVMVTKLLTAFISVERCLCVVIPLRIKQVITGTRVKIYSVCCYTIVILTFLPIYYTKRIQWKFSPKRNRTILGMVYVDDRERIESVVYLIINVFYSLVPFVVISISTAFLVVTLQKNSKWRRGVTRSATTTTSNEPPATTKASRKESRVSRMVMTISVLFIACFLPHAAGLVLQLTVEGFSLAGKYKRVLVVLGSFTFLLEPVNSSCNIFIYYANSSNYRNMFRQIFGYKDEEEKKKKKHQATAPVTVVT